MRINTNIAALRSCYHLGSADDKLSTSLLKLSSGNKLIDIKENPVGASMSVKMRTQIRNLDRANQNTEDGISVIQTAEGALTEINSMLQRINELCVQGASDFYTDDDRESIMQEINEITEEIDRVSNDTDFNTKPLIDGTLAKKTYTNTRDAKITYTSDEVPIGEYALTYEDTAERAVVSIDAMTDGNIPEGRVVINGAAVEIEAGDSLRDVYEKFMKAGDKTGIKVSYTGSLEGTAEFTFTHEEFGTAYSIDISTSDEMAAKLGLADKNVSVSGKDGTVTNIVTDPTLSKFSSSATYSVSGREITVKNYDGFEMKIQISEDMAKKNSPMVILGGVADAGTMTIQVGANEYQEMEIEIPAVNSETLGIDKIKAYTAQGCGNGITISSEAVSYVSTIRSRLGAYQNRMEHTISSLDVSEENMTASLSRIEDVDMAEEMTNYTTYNVMSQAATSMLAQANQLPEKVLQLLQ